MITGDIVAFYTNVDTETIDRAMEAIMLGARWTKERAYALGSLVKMVTKESYFENDGYLYRQTQGLAMGSPSSGTIANLALARREKNFVRREGILTYTRYIDDVFCLMEAKDLTEVQRILQEASGCFALLEVKWNISERRAVYLDVEIDCAAAIGYTIGPYYSYRPYRKPGNQHALLPWSSAHPIHVKKGIVIGETTRLALICSEEPTFHEEVARFRDRLLRRGYPEKALHAWTRRVTWSSRSGILSGARTTDESRRHTLRIPTSYNVIWENIDLSKVFEKVAESWQNVWDSDTRPSALSLSQSRGTNVMDLMSSWNKFALGELDDTDGLSDSE